MTIRKIAATALAFLLGAALLALAYIALPLTLFAWSAAFTLCWTIGSSAVRAAGWVCTTWRQVGTEWEL